MNKIIWMIVAGVSLVASPWMWGSEAAPDDRLDRLEKEMENLRFENRELRRQLGLDGSTNRAGLVKANGKSFELKVGGFVQAHAEFGDDGDARWAGNCQNDRFFIRRARVHLLGSFLEHFNYKLQADFAGSLAAVEGQKVSMTDGWVNWNRYEGANIKAGQFYPMFGYEKRMDPLKLPTVELTLPGIRLLPERQLGVQMQGEALEKRAGYSMGVFNGNNLNNNFNDNENFMVVGRVEGVPLKRKVFDRDATWIVGASSYYSDDARVNLAPEFCPGTNYFTGIRLGLGVDTQFRLGPWSVNAEFIQTDFEPVTAPEFTARGWYAQAGYFFLPKWQGIVGYESFDPNTDVAGDITHTWTFGLDYCIKGDSLKLSANYLLMDIPGVDGLEGKVLLRMQAEF